MTAEQSKPNRPNHSNAVTCPPPADRSRIEVLKDFIHRLRGPVCLLQSLRPDVATWPLEAQELFDEAMRRLLLLVQECSDDVARDEK
jgi:hypothetical protein